jgi:hypothetical protein
VAGKTLLGKGQAIIYSEIKAAFPLTVFLRAAPGYARLFNCAMLKQNGYIENDDYFLSDFKREMRNDPASAAGNVAKENRFTFYMTKLIDLISVKIPSYHK